MTREQDFWHWFVEHESELLNFEVDQERIFDQLASQLRKIDENLVFEFGPKGARREFIVSADGIKSAFPAVIALVNAVPKLDRWQVIAFRPRRTPPNGVVIGDKQIDPENVEFTLLDNGTTAGIQLFIPGLQKEKAVWKQLGYLLLDEALGEYDVEARLGPIEMLATDAQTEWERRPLAELPSAFDQMVARLEGRSGKPS
jgi:hypothetical protein